MQRKLDNQAPIDFSHYAEQASQRLEMFTHYAHINGHAQKLEALEHVMQAVAALSLTAIAYKRHVAEYQVSLKRLSSIGPQKEG